MTKIKALFLGSILLLLLSACSSNSQSEPQSKDLDQTEQTASKAQTPSAEEIPANELQIRVKGEGGQNIVFQLNDSPAGNTLQEQLPLSIQVENYGHNEKIFYPPNELNTSETPLAEEPSGTLAYYAPWGNVVLYFGECGGASGLYALGKAVLGTEQIETLSGEIQIEAVSSE